MEDKRQQLEPDMKQWTGSKLGKEYIKAVYCHSAYLTYMQCTSCEMLSQMTHKLESKIAGRDINDFRYADDTTQMAGNKEELKNRFQIGKEYIMAVFFHPAS